MRAVHYRLAALLLAAWPLFGAPETVRPTSIDSVVGYTDCAVGYIDEDPDSPDSEWCNVAGANNVDTSVRASLANPTNPPTSTTLAQEIKVWLRKTNHSTNPTCAVSIRENDVSRFSAGLGAISSTTGVLHTRTWTFDPAEWDDDTGASIEAQVTCTVGGGNPSNKASGEVGAVEVNLDTAEAPVGFSPQFTIVLQ